MYTLITIIRDMDIDLQRFYFRKFLKVVLYSGKHDFNHEKAPSPQKKTLTALLLLKMRKAENDFKLKWRK